MTTERRQSLQGEFLNEFNQTGRIDRKNAARVFNERRDPYIQNGLREQVVTELRDVLNQEAEKKQERIKELSGTLENTFAQFPEDERESVAQKVKKMSDEELNKMSDEGKTKEAVEIIDDPEKMLRIFNEKAKQLLEEKNAKIAQEEQKKVKAAEIPIQTDKALKPEQPEQLPKKVEPKTKPEPEATTPAKLSPDNKTKPKSLFGRIKSGFNNIKKRFKAFFKSPTETESPDQKDKAPNPKQPEQHPKEAMPNTNPEPEATTPTKLSPEANKGVQPEKPKSVEISPEKRKAIEDIVDKRLKELGVKKKGGFKEKLKAFFKSPFVRKTAVFGLGIATAISAVAVLQYFGYLLPFPINHVFTIDNARYIIK